MFAFWEIGTGNKLSVLSIAFDELAVFAVRAGLTGFFRWFDDFAFFGQRSIAFRKTGAAEEFSVACQLDHHLRSALGTEGSFRCVTDIGDLVDFFFALHFFGKRRVELAECLFIFALTIGDIVEFVFHIGSK